MASAALQSVIDTVPKYQLRYQAQKSAMAPGSETNSGPGLLYVSKASNSGTTPGTGAPVRNSNLRNRGNNLNTDMTVTSKSTTIAQDFHQSRNTGAPANGPNRNYKQTKSSRHKWNAKNMSETPNYKRNRVGSANLTNGELFIKYTKSTSYAFDLENDVAAYSDVNAFIAKCCSDVGLSQTDAKQSSLKAAGASLAGDDTENMRSYKSLLSNTRNKYAKTLITEEKDGEATVNCWKDGVIYAERLIIAKTGHFINFAKVHPVSFTERFGKNKEVPVWSGIMMFANIYSKPKAHYPANLLAMFDGNVANTRKALYGKVETNSNNETIHIKGIACLIKERIPQVDSYRFTCYKMTYNLFDVSRTIINTISKLAKMLKVKVEDKEDYKNIEAYTKNILKITTWEYNPNKLEYAKQLLIQLITLYGIDYKEGEKLEHTKGPIITGMENLFGVIPFNVAINEDDLQAMCEATKGIDKQEEE